jgi:hypothetical protein
MAFSILSDFFGAPYVPTSAKMVEEILAASKLKKGQLFIELGSGDGRIVRTAVAKYQVRGIGIDIHWVLNVYARILSRLRGLRDISFVQANVYHYDFSKADVIFTFLLPRMMVKLRPKLDKELRKGTLVISHGFAMKGWEKKLIKKIDRKLFPTYYYKI